MEMVYSSSKETQHYEVRLFIPVGRIIAITNIALTACEEAPKGIL